MEIPLVCYCNAFFMTCPHTSPRSGLFIQAAVCWTTGSFLKLVALTCILPVLKCYLLLWLFLAWHFSSIPPTQSYMKLPWGFFTSFKAEIEISSPELDESCILQTSQSISLQPNHYSCKEKGNKSHGSNSSFKLMSWDICSTFRSFHQL